MANFSDSFSTIASKVADTAGSAVRDVLGLNAASGNPLTDEMLNTIENASNWQVEGQNWYKLFGYRFTVEKYTSDKSPLADFVGPTVEKQMHFMLPIPPQSLQIEPVMPSAETATMGGVVNEVSAVKFWNIAMSGTNGTAISRADGDEYNREQMAGKFRDKITTTGALSSLFRGVNDAVSQATGILNNAADIVNAGSLTGAVGSAASLVNDAFLPQMPYQSSAVNGGSNGFKESLELQKFFYAYNQLRGKFPKLYQMFFYNFQTNQKWKINIKNFSLTKNSQKPHLFRYNIVMRGWDVEEVGAGQAPEVDRFGPNGDLRQVNLFLSERARLGIPRSLKLGNL